MTLFNNVESFTTSGTDNLQPSTATWDHLYCSHIWSNSNFRRAIINNTSSFNNSTNHCYSCNVKRYELRSPRDFHPDNHSTPNRRGLPKEVNLNTNEVNILYERDRVSLTNSIVSNDNINIEERTQYIPTISHQIESQYHQKFISYDMRHNENKRKRLRKSIKGIGCIVRLSLTDSPMKKRTQIQAFSISVMVLAIVIISLVLVNFTTPTRLIRASNVSTTVVPTHTTQEYNDTMTIDTGTWTSSFETATEDRYSTLEPILLKPSNASAIVNVRKSIRTFPKSRISQKSKEINNREISDKFCSCQNDEICMLDENSGTSICKKSIDKGDPTGCGGLCALETEACQLVDRERGVRVCRVLVVATCSDDQWRCRNGLCVPATARCDGSIQCYDRSDEMHCECDLKKQFRCGHSISCFNNSKQCDGVIDCWDGIDEINCTSDCPSSKFACNDGHCIMSNQFCDGYPDCPDRSDEPQGCDANCGANEARCKNGRCVGRLQFCDGIDQCGDKTDELDCHNVTGVLY